MLNNSAILQNSFSANAKKVAYIRFRCDKCVCVIFHPLNFLFFEISPTRYIHHYMYSMKINIMAAYEKLQEFFLRFRRENT